MELNANVKCQKGIACFRVRKERAAVYSAELLYFDGDQKFSPPQSLTLLRGIRQWNGSIDDKDLLNQLGKIIEEAYTDPATS